MSDDEMTVGDAASIVDRILAEYSIEVGHVIACADWDDLERVRDFLVLAASEERDDPA